MCVCVCKHLPLALSADVLEDDDHVKGGGAEGKDTVNNGRQQEGGQGEGSVQMYDLGGSNVP